MSKSDLKKVAKREQLFSTLAKNEGKSNAKLAKKAHGENKKDLKFEVKVDKDFAKLRAQKAASARQKAGK